MAHAKDNQQNKILKTFKEFELKHKKFMDNDMQYRAEFETFAEAKYEPAVKEMILELDKGKCHKCVVPYLKTMALSEGSANEEITFDFRNVIQKHTAKVSEACKKISKAEIKKLKLQADAVFQYMEADKIADIEIKKLKLILKPCLL